MQKVYHAGGFASRPKRFSAVIGSGKKQRGSASAIGLKLFECALSCAHPVATELAGRIDDESKRGPLVVTKEMQEAYEGNKGR